MRIPLMAAGLAIVLTGCVAAPAGPPPVPAAQIEVVPPAPSTRVVWQPGGWHWNGGAYFWRPGHYVERLAAYHHWVPGHWGPDGAWIPGHWA